MRLIGRIDNETNAKIFGDYLTCLDVGNTIETESDGRCGVWVHSEDQMEQGNRALVEFLANPKDTKYQRAGDQAAGIRKKQEKEKTEFANRVITGESMWANFGLGPLTVVLIAACVGVVLFGGGFPSETNGNFYGKLLISNYLVGLPEIRHGEYWRLITPAFIHWDFLHIFFNMLWLKDLGSMIEARKGWLTLLLQTLVIAAVSNYCQFLVSGPFFGGMSGVVYGLFGYIWMRGKFEPTSGLRLHPSNVVMMIGWYFLCLIHLIPHVANTVHGVGLVMGMIWGGGPPLLKKLFKA